jgi:apolipoprotein N-acyltransferase
MEKLTALLNRYPRWLALLAGGISATGFAPLNLWPLTLICFALLMHLVASAQTGKRAFLIGWLFGMGYFTIGNNWIANAFTFQDAMPAWLGWLAVPLLSLYLALYPALATWGAWRIARRVKPDVTHATLPFVLAFAGCWIITEWLRSWVFTGFAWNPLSASTFGTFNSKPTNAILAAVGTYGASGASLLIIGLLAIPTPPDKTNADMQDQPRWQLNQQLLVGLLIVLFMLLLALDIPERWTGYLETKSQKAQGATTNITIVQPNISQTDKYAVGYEAINFSRFAQNSRPKDTKPRLLLWPEAAVPWWLADGYPTYVYRNQPGGSAEATRALLARLLGPDDILLAGTDLLEYDKTGEVVGARNSILAIDARGDIKARYDKAHLVPYGEYLALRWLLEPLGATRLVPGSLDFLPGPGPRTLNLGVGKPKVGVQLCYEIIFSGQVVDRTNRPDFIFNPSADAWFGSWGSPQFLAQSKLRAIEEGLPVIRSTPTGISAIVDANGRVLETLSSGKAGRIDARLPIAKAPTLFARYGNILPVGFALLLIALSFLPLAPLSLAGRRTSR